MFCVPLVMVGWPVTISPLVEGGGEGGGVTGKKPLDVFKEVRKKTPAMFVVSKTGILSQNRMFSQP